MGKFNDLQDKVVVITGGDKNLGGLLSTTYAKEGVKLVIHHNNENSLKEAKLTLEKVESLGAEGTLFSGDLTKIENLEALFKHTEKNFGKVDIAINTVGKVFKKSITEITEQEFDCMQEINGKSAYFFIKYAERYMNNDGKIVTSLLSTYTGEKAPIEHYTRAASKEFMEKGISVNAIATEPMDTPFFYPHEEDAVAFHQSQALHNQLTDSKGIVPIIKFLTLNGWWINGQTLFVNSGHTTR